MYLLQNGMTLVLNGRSLVSHPRSTAPEHDVDALIVGAGPVGLYAAYYAGFRGLSVAVLDSLPEIGGQVSAMYPEKLIYDMAGFPAVKGRDLIAGLADQAGRYGPRTCWARRPAACSYENGAPVVTTSAGLKGSGPASSWSPAASARSRPGPCRPWPGSRTGAWPTSCPEPQQYRDRDVVIVGGGDSAFDWALTLSPVARSVTVVHRRAAFRAHEGLVRQVAGPAGVRWSPTPKSWRPRTATAGSRPSKSWTSAAARPAG